MTHFSVSFSGLVKDDIGIMSVLKSVMYKIVVGCSVSHMNFACRRIL